MNETEYREGVTFIKRTSGTEEEEIDRLYWWKELARPLVGKSICKRAGERVYL